MVRQLRMPVAMGIAVLLGAGTAWAFGTFSDGRVISMPGDVWGVTIADVDRDGRGDIVAGNGEGSADLAALLIGKKGGFEAPVDLGSGADPEGVAVGRINRGPLPDIVVVNYGDEDISVFTQRRDGSFRRRADLPAGPGAWTADLVDLNRDGALDIVTSNYDNTAGEDAVSVHLGKGDGSFRPLMSFDGGTEGWGLATGLMGADRRPDVVGYTGDGTLTVYRTRKDGSLAITDNEVLDAYDLPSPVAIADFTRDGKNDVAVATESGFKIFRGNGKGKVGLKQTVEVPGATGYSVGAANFDRDRSGRPDLAYLAQKAGSSEYGFWIFRLRPNGTFLRGPWHPLSDEPDSLAIGRINRDNAPDLAVGTDTSVDVFKNLP